MKMQGTIQQIVNALTQRKSIDGWPPEVPPRSLSLFSDLVDILPQDIERLIQSDTPDDQLRALGALYQSGEYQRIRAFFKSNPDRLGNEGKLLLVLTYLQLFRDKFDRLERFTAPMIKELTDSEPSEFSSLHEWFQNLIQERPMPPTFYARPLKNKEIRR